MNSSRPRMPVPLGELRPAELLARIQEWALAQGYQVETRPHATEYAIMTIRDPRGGFTITGKPNAHRGRRIRRDQVRYVINKLNARWKE